MNYFSTRHNIRDSDLDLLRRVLSREWDLLLRGLLDLLLLLEWDLRRDLLFDRLPKKKQKKTTR